MEPHTHCGHQKEQSVDAAIRLSTCLVSGKSHALPGLHPLGCVHAGYEIDDGLCHCPTDRLVYSVTHCLLPLDLIGVLKKKNRLAGRFALGSSLRLEMVIDL